MTGTCIVGLGSTTCGRFLETSPKLLAKAATGAALADAGIGADEVDAVFVANALAGLIDGQECVRGEAFLRESPLLGLPIFNVENACASGSTALHLACQGIASGTYETVVVLGIEKMSHPEKARSFAALEGALDVEETARDDRADASRSIFMDIYASKARRHAELYGSTPADLARVVVKNRRHAKHNPVAQYRNELTVRQVLESRSIVEPLTLPMCSPIGDGAAALVVTTAERGGGREHAVPVAATAVVTGRPGRGSAVARAARLAYEQAGIGPEDVGVAEVHDATSSAEIEEYEHLGFAREGEGHLLAASEATALGGRLPVNTSGGLISRGHPVGATGVYQIVELLTQLRGHSAARQVEPRPRYGLAQNAGGFVADDVAAAVVTILAAA